MNLGQPFHVGNPIPTGYQQPDGFAMVMRQGFAIHFKRQHNFGAHGIFYGKAASKGFFNFTTANFFHRGVGTKKNDFLCAGLNTGLFQNICQGNSAPPRIADEPLKQTPTIATALEANLLFDDIPAHQVLQ